MEDRGATKLSPENKAKLREGLITYFNDEEMKTLCVDLGIDYGNLSGTTKASKARELIGLIERLNRIPDLIVICKAERPKVDWNQFIKEKESEDNPRKQISADIESLKQGKENKQMRELKEGKLRKSQVWWALIIVALIAFVGIIISIFVNSTSDSVNFDYPIRVQSVVTGNAIPNAKVIIEVAGQAPLDEFTDSNGFSRIFIDSSRVNQPARLIVQATDYLQHTQNIDLKEDILPDVIQLQPKPVNQDEYEEKPSLTPTNITTLTPLPSPTEPFTPTSTPTSPPPPTQTPNCSSVTGVFASVWTDTRDRIGCASSSAITGQIVEENFVGGKMIWREPIDTAQALVVFNNETWKIYQHEPYIEGGPEYSCVDNNTLAQTPPTPKRGFGAMWCDIPEIRNGLGNALEAERAFTGSMQQFDNGFMVQTDNNNIFIFYSTGNWEQR